MVKDRAVLVWSFCDAKNQKLNISEILLIKIGTKIFVNF